MRAYSLALVIFIFMLSLSFVSTTIMADYKTGVDIGGMGHTGQTPEEWYMSNADEIEEIGNSATDEATTGDADFSWYNNIYKPVALGMPMVLGVFYDCTFGLKAMLISIKVPDSLALILSIIAWFIYIIGLIQWITNRGFKQVN